MITKKEFKKLKRNKELLPEHVSPGFQMPNRFREMTQKDHDILLVAIDQIEIDSFIDGL